MADSIKERILANYETALKAVTVANGYKRTLNLVDRFQVGGMEQNFPVVVEVKQGVDIASESLASIGNAGAEGHTMALFTIIKFRHDPSEDGLSTSKVGIEHEEDVYRAALADRTRGGLAFDTRWISTDEMEVDEDGNRAVLAVNFEIDYRHLLGDMTL